MRVVIAGGHGKIAQILATQLATRGDEAVSLIRNPDHSTEIIGLGAKPVLFDLESGAASDLAEILADADAVVFAAGAGPGSSAARKDSVDRGGAALLADAAEIAGVRRYLMVSVINADAGPQPQHDEVYAAYVTAKKAADDDLRGRDLDWTVLRPGGLTDDPGTGLVLLTPYAERDTISREDVAATLVGLLDAPATAGHSVDVVRGETPILHAISALTS